jgi:hypothetical protein
MIRLGEWSDVWLPHAIECARGKIRRTLKSVNSLS